MHVDQVDGEAPQHLRRLTSLRAFAALLVFFLHLDIRGGTVGSARSVLQFGYVGVGFFFLLSGFVLAWSFRANDGKARFYVRRFARIYPSHAVMLLVAAVAPVTVVAFRPEQLVYTAALVQTWAPGWLDPYAVNGVSWSLSCEAAFYAVLPLLIPVLARLGPRTRWLFAFGWWAAGALVTTAVGAVTGGWQDALYVFPPLRFGEFCLGVVAAMQFRRGWRMPKRVGVALVVVGLLAEPARASDLPRSRPRRGAGGARPGPVGRRTRCEGSSRLADAPGPWCTPVRSPSRSTSSTSSSSSTSAR
jgi:peptidoglycan/LPS O-acetylase OafA/YrhL